MSDQPANFVAANSLLPRPCPAEPCPTPDASPSRDSLTVTSELSAAYRTLEESERRFRTLADAAPIGMFLTDAQGKIVYVNPLCQKLSGFSLEGHSEDGWLVHVHPNDLPGLRRAIEQARQARTDMDLEFRFIYPPGAERWVHSRTKSICSPTGERTGMIGTVEDITARKHSEAELERVNQELIRASREAGMTEVTTGVLHNIKNVLSSVNVSANLISDQLRQSRVAVLARISALLRDHAADLGAFLCNDPKGKLLPGYFEQLTSHLTQEQSNLLAEVAQLICNIEHIKELVAAQQSYSRISGTHQRVRLVSLIDDALKMNAAALTRHGVQVTCELEPDLPEVVLEKHKLLQILVNLIRNAKEACQDRSSARRLLVRANRDYQVVRIAVRDNGVGIATENLPRLFSRGFTTKVDGHGFGLHSASLAARELGGALTAQSDGPGTGATFTLELPLPDQE